MKTRGVTLMEILIGVFIIAIAFIPILSAVQFGNRSTVKINNYSKATKLAQGLIEECKHVPIKKYQDKVKATTDGSLTAVDKEFFPQSSKEFLDFGQSLKEFAYVAQMKVLRHPDDKEKIREIWIQVEVNWKEGDGTTAAVPRQVKVGNAIHNPESD